TPALGWRPHAMPRLRAPPGEDALASRQPAHRRPACRAERARAVGAPASRWPPSPRRSPPVQRDGLKTSSILRSLASARRRRMASAGRSEKRSRWRRKLRRLSNYAFASGGWELGNVRAGDNCTTWARSRSTESYEAPAPKITRSDSGDAGMCLSPWHSERGSLRGLLRTKARRGFQALAPWGGNGRSH